MMMKRDKQDEEVQKSIWYDENINPIYEDENRLRKLWEKDAKIGAWALSEKQREKLLERMNK